MRRAYVVELGALDIAQLEAAVGLLQGILGGIQMIEIPEQGDEMVEPGVELGPLPEQQEGREPDPNFMPPPPAPPMNRQEDFGAGPPPRLG